MDENALLKIKNEALINDNQFDMKHFDHLFYIFLYTFNPSWFPLSVLSFYIFIFVQIWHEYMVNSFL